MSKYNYFYTYMVGTAGYELTAVEVTYATVEVKAGNPVIMVDSTNGVTSQSFVDAFAQVCGGEVTVYW